ncbi:MAG: exosortase/archaeosortase family protein [Puniceicoccales bacterium]|jgi:exosortase/archaeosortase family protein|nr:exosortase/archaeosortase family protein [Puniceicoccales bacterium]
MTSIFASLAKPFSEFARLDTPRRAALLLLPVFLAVVIYEQSYQWGLREDYFFGYLTLPLCAWVLYERWPEIRKIFLGGDASPDTPPAPPPLPSPLASRLWDIPANAAVAGGTLLFMLGAFMRAIGGPNVFATYFNTCGFVAVFFGTAWLLCARDAAGHPLGFRERREFIRLLVFPGLVWLLSGPALYIMDTQVKIFLLLNVTKLVGALMNAMELNVTVSANYIILPPRSIGGPPDTVGVADACSGVRSLTACIFMGSFLSAIMVKGLFRKVILLGLSLVLALVLNFIRTTFLGVWSYKYGSPTIDLDPWGNAPKIPDPTGVLGADGAVQMIANPQFSIGAIHDIAGYAAMALTFIFLLLFIPLVNLRLRLSDAEVRERKLPPPVSPP